MSAASGRKKQAGLIEEVTFRQFWLHVRTKEKNKNLISHPLPSVGRGTEATGLNIKNDFSVRSVARVSVANGCEDCF